MSLATNQPGVTRQRRWARIAATGALLALIVVAVVAVAADGGKPKPPEPLPLGRATTASFTPKVVVRGLEGPTWAGTAPGEAPNVLWVAERTGRLVRLSGPSLEKRTVWVDLTGEVSTSAEQGLLSVAFAPDFGESREVVLSFTDPAGNSQIELWVLATKPGSARRVRSLLTVDQPFPNHNGGHVEFGAHRTLYAGFGDGGGAQDPSDRSQDPKQPFGKILSADLTRGGKPTWVNVATGLRNPWRFWFDPALGEMWIGDVGQDLVEEIDRIRLDLSTPRPNLGWSLYEGTHRIDGGDREIRGTQELSWPVASYDHEAGRCSVTGGVIYRGAKVPALRGRYVFADFCTGEVMSVMPGAGMAASDLRIETASVAQPAHIGLDAEGELIVGSLDGTISRLGPPAAGS